MTNMRPCKPCQNGISGKVDRNVNDRTYRDYNLLRNKPSIEGMKLEGDTSLTDLGIPYVWSATTDEWNEQSSLVSVKDAVYIYTDYKTVDDKLVPGFKIGDGLAFLIDLPFVDAEMQEHLTNDVIHITSEERTFWNNKVRCYMDGENLIFTTD